MVAVGLKMKFHQGVAAMILLHQVSAGMLQADMSSPRLRSAVLLSNRQDPVAEQLKTAADAHAEAAEAIKIAADALKDTTFSLQKTMKQVSDSVAASRVAAKDHIEKEQKVARHDQVPVPPPVPQPAAPIPAADSAGPGAQPGIPPLLVPPPAKLEPPLLGATLSASG